ncbi:hypothetical protein ACH40F_08305 [Streptomyces sp. NPDC020794]|uniref:hypothetical protein n=1 Tax=unclassified Streptomyces TaxID=2593676 RepID=UPI0036EBCE47
MTRLRVVGYLVAAIAVAAASGAVVALPFHGATARLTWTVVALAVAALAGALTPSWASPYSIRKEGRS